MHLLQIVNRLSCEAAGPNYACGSVRYKQHPRTASVARIYRSLLRIYSCMNVKQVFKPMQNILQNIPQNILPRHNDSIDKQKQALVHCMSSLDAADLQCSTTPNSWTSIQHNQMYLNYSPLEPGAAAAAPVLVIQAGWTISLPLPMGAAASLPC